MGWAIDMAAKERPMGFEDVTTPTVYNVTKQHSGWEDFEDPQSAGWLGGGLSHIWLEPREEGDPREIFKKSRKSSLTFIKKNSMDTVSRLSMNHKSRGWRKLYYRA